MWAWTGQFGLGVLLAQFGEDFGGRRRRGIKPKGSGLRRMPPRRAYGGPLVRLAW